MGKKRAVQDAILRRYIEQRTRAGWRFVGPVTRGSGHTGFVAEVPGAGKTFLLLLPKTSRRPRAVLNCIAGLERCVRMEANDGQ